MELSKKDEKLIDKMIDKVPYTTKEQYIGDRLTGVVHIRLSDPVIDLFKRVRKAQERKRIKRKHQNT